MRNSLLEHIIRTILFEDAEEISSDAEKFPVRITTLVGTDKTDYLDAGAIYGFDVKVVAKRFKGERTRATEDVLFNSINDTLRQPFLQKISNIVNQSGLIALISGDFRPSARIFSFRCWIFESAYWNNQRSLLRKKDTEVVQGDRITIITSVEYRIGNAEIKKFLNGDSYGGMTLVNDIGLTQENVDVAGLKQYEIWYNKLRKINKTLPTIDFQITDISKLPKQYTEIPAESELENEEIQIQQYIGTGSKKLKTFLFTGTADDATYDYYSGDVIDPTTSTICFTGTLKRMRGLDTYEFWQGTLNNYKYWEGASGKIQNFVISGKVDNGNISNATTILSPSGETRTWQQYLDSKK
jgi:hypothetical protein